MSIETILQPKTDAEIEHLLKILPGEQLIEMGVKLDDPNLIKFGIEKTGAKVWAKDYSSSSASFFDNMINLKTLYEIVEINLNDKRGEVVTKGLMKGDEYDYSLKFFAGLFTPIYPDNKHIKIMNDTLDKAHQLFKQK